MPDFGKWESLRGESVTLNDKITILGFGGFDIVKNRGNLFNLNEKIYQRYHEFKDLQFVMICPKGTEADVAGVLDALDDFTDVSQWHFLFATPEEIKTYFEDLKLREKLDVTHGTSNVFIIDKERNLRGRTEEKEYREGYDTFHPSELNNEMLDDFKIVLYEYRAALKKNHNASKQL